MHSSSLLLAGLSLFAGSFAQGPECDCGFFDPSTGNIFTEKLIVYFNETTILPNGTFSAQNYENPWEKAWNAIYRTGADDKNINITHTTRSSHWNANQSLALTVEPTTKYHVVTGASLQSLRKDIQYGSFRTLVKPAQSWMGGTAMSMFLQFNDTQNIHMSSINTNEPETAWFNTLTGDEFADRNLGFNFTDIITGTNGTFADSGVEPWGFTEMRVDWNEKNVSYFIGNVLTRVATYKQEGLEGFPSTPMSLILRHWSDGDEYYMEGPPLHNRTVAYVGYTRAFFNSSTWDKDQHASFNSRCQLADACSMDNPLIRGATEFPHQATKAYKWAHTPSAVHNWAVAIISASVAITVLLICNIIIQRWPTKASKQPKPEKINYCRRLPSQIASTSSGYSSGEATAIATPINLTRPSSFELAKEGKEIDAMKISEIGPSRFGSSATLNQMGSPRHGSYSPMLGAMTPARVGSSSTLNTFSPTRVGSSATLNNLPAPRLNSQISSTFPPTKEEDKKDVKAEDVKVSAKEVPARPAGPVHAVTTTSLAKPDKPLQPRQRIDYLAGLISLVTLFVSLEHFMFTFVPAVAMPGAPYHYRSEVWANTIIGTFIFNQIYLGVFFITSTRFLIMKFLRTGKLESIAEKVTTRVFRVWVPIMASALLQYFLIDIGATKWLMYLPSVTWSTWPYTLGYPDFSHYISEIIELVYLIPNAAPQITFNYCTGVLWTIPVQIQGSWISLMGAVLVNEIKNPWKRAGYYLFCVINHWYAQSWGSFFWLGVMLVDLDLTFKYKTWFQSHRLIFYSIMSLCTVLALAGLMQDGITRWNDEAFSMPVLENGIHPDIRTGLTIEQAGNGGYPDYVKPRFNGLIFAIGLQFVVENCEWVQNFLSMKIFLMIFPHIFTIYLSHGLVFWTLGAVICTHLNAYLPYWAVILVTGVASYGTLFAGLPLLTPIVETLGKDVAANIWVWAHIEPAPKKRSLYPFREDLFFEGNREADDGTIVEETEKDMEKMARSRVDKV